MNVDEMIDRVVEGEDPDELVEAKSFTRLPKSAVNVDLFSVNKQLDAFYGWVSRGNDIDIKQLDSIIDSLTRIKKQAKTFKDVDAVKGTPYDF